MSVTQRVVAATVAALVVLAAIVLVATMAGGPVGRADPTGSTAPSAEPTPSATVTTSEAPASADPSTGEEADLLATLAEIEEQVIAIRGLEAADIGPPGSHHPRRARRRAGGSSSTRSTRSRSRSGTTWRSARSACWDRTRTWRSSSSSCSGTRVLGFYDGRSSEWSWSRTRASTRAQSSRTPTSTRMPCRTRPSNHHSFDPDADLEDDQALALTSMTEGDATRHDAGVGVRAPRASRSSSRSAASSCRTRPASRHGWSTSSTSRTPPDRCGPAP